MNISNRLKFFAALYVGVFIAAMWICTGGVMDIATYASIPVILTAEAIVLSMLYATIFCGGDEEHAVVKVPQREPARVISMKGRTA